MTDEEIISGLVKISNRLSKTKMEEALIMPKNSLATILSGNKPIPPKHRNKMIDYIGTIETDTEAEIARNNEPDNKERILAQRNGVDGPIGAIKRQEIDYSAYVLDESTGFEQRLSIEGADFVTIMGNPAQFMVLKSQYDAALAEIKAWEEKYATLLSENQYLKEENEAVKADNYRMGAMINALERKRGEKQGQSFAIKPEDKEQWDQYAQSMKNAYNHPHGNAHTPISKQGEEIIKKRRGF